MSDDPLSKLNVKEAIDLRWTLRDIKAGRWLLCPVNPLNLEKLVELGLVELRGEDHPVLTNAGIDAIL